MEDMRRQLAPVRDGADWSEVARRLWQGDLTALQTYWVDTQRRDWDPFQQEPEWRPQRGRAAVQVRLGVIVRARYGPLGPA